MADRRSKRPWADDQKVLVFADVSDAVTWDELELTLTSWDAGHRRKPR